MELTEYVGTLTLLGDESRLRLCALLRDRELRVGDLVRVTGISQSRVSTHLARLREGGFVRDRREGPHAFYSLANDSLPTAAKAVLDEPALASDPTLQGDRKRLAELETSQEFSSPFADEVARQYSPGRTWQSLSVGLAALLDLGDVLDVGSGDGAVASYLATNCRSLTCIDVDPRMVEATSARLGERATVQLADAHSLPFDDASFDCIVLFHTLAYAEDPRTVVRECARVLRKGGRLVLLSLDAHDHGELTAAYGERHNGFSPAALRTLFATTELSLTFCDVASRESKKPHFQIVLAVAESPQPSRSSRRSRT